jgi:CheY-like chemotaxis protein
LVVEDEEPIRELIVSALKKDGFNVLEASNPHAAAEIIGTGLFEVDLLFADIIMPNMSGHQFALEMLSMRPDLKIVFATGSNQDELRHDLRDIPHHFFLSKPYTAEELRKAVTSALSL